MLPHGEIKAGETSLRTPPGHVPVVGGHHFCYAGLGVGGIFPQGWGASEPLGGSPTELGQNRGSHLPPGGLTIDGGATSLQIDEHYTSRYMDTVRGSKQRGPESLTGC